MVKQSPAQRANLTAWTVEKIGRCESLNQASSLMTTMRHKGAYERPMQDAYAALKARLYPEVTA